MTEKCGKCTDDIPCYKHSSSGIVDWEEELKLIWEWRKIEYAAQIKMVDDYISKSLEMENK